MVQLQGVTLGTIGGGALPELFEAELTRVLANITDPNTDAKAKRSIALSVTFKPNADRDEAEIAVSCSAKLAGIKTVSGRLYVGKRAGKLVAVENDPRQSNLFDQPPKPAPVAVGEFGKGSEG